MPNHYNGKRFILQVFFPKKFKNIPGFLQKKPEKAEPSPAAERQLQRKPQFLAGNTAVFRFYVYQNDVRSHFPDTAPRNDIVFPLSPQTEKTAGTGDDDGKDLSFRQVDPGIADITQPLPVAYRDDFLTVQIREFYRHRQTPRKGFGAVYAREQRNMPPFFRIPRKIFAWY